MNRVIERDAVVCGCEQRGRGFSREKRRKDLRVLAFLEHNFKNLTSDELVVSHLIELCGVEGGLGLIECNLWPF